MEVKFWNSQADLGSLGSLVSDHWGLGGLSASDASTVGSSAIRFSWRLGIL